MNVFWLKCLCNWFLCLVVIIKVEQSLCSLWLMQESMEYSQISNWIPKMIKIKKNFMKKIRFECHEKKKRFESSEKNKIWM